MKIGWSTDFVVLDGAAAALPQIRQVDQGHAAWVVVRWHRPGASAPLAWVFSRDEFFARLKATTVPYRPGTQARLEDVFALHALPASIPLVMSGQPPEIRKLAGDAMASTHAQRTGMRYVDLQGAPGEPAETMQVAAVGGPDLPPPPPLRKAVRRSAPVTRGGPPPIARSAPPPPPPPPPPMTRGLPREAEPEAAAAAAPDEGTMPVRFPSVEPEGAVQAGQPLVLVVDLQREESTTTLGGEALFPEMAADWSTFDVDVALSSPDIDFDAGGRGTLQVRRNAASVAARITGRVHAGLAAGHTLQVKARFLLGQRLCGSALRMLALDGAVAPPAPANTPPAVVQIDTEAGQPDLTVEISIPQPDQPGRLSWSMWPVRFDDCPADLNGMIDLGQKPAAEASALFNRFAKLERGAHVEAIEGFGEELWTKSPPEFQAVYWALWDHLKRPLTIQFITDDPHMPWELMNPSRAGEQHGPIALKHAVARWLVSYKGYLENRLPKGQVVAMAPHYSGALELERAEAAAKALETEVQAKPLGGTRAELLKLLETPPPEPVAMLFFTGHGAFSTDVAGASRLKLEDGGEITPMEVKRQKVTLGQRDGTVVFLNACEVGATGSVLGNVGGWADAFLAREFRAFIAPLWAIDEEDASQVTAELMQAIVKQQQPLGEALRDLRAKHGTVSPTFYSYLLYGDVTARLGTA